MIVDIFISLWQKRKDLHKISDPDSYLFRSFEDVSPDLNRNIPIPEKYSAENSFDIIEERISNLMIGKLRQKRRYMSVIASVFILFILSFIFIKQQISNENIRIITVSTGVDEQLELQLPDNSTVMLGSLSSFSYPEKFDDDKREVSLTGEGYFNVAEDKTKPFKIKTGEINIRISGTIFNIKAYGSDNFIEIKSIEGPVIIDYNEKSQMINPGETTRFNKNKS
jgi:ferric-dicitrate binding protein FerR (iron transport regulator)